MLVARAADPSGCTQARGCCCGRVWKELLRRKAPSYSHRAPPSPLSGEKGCSPPAQASPSLIPGPGGAEVPRREPGSFVSWRAPRRGVVRGCQGPALWLCSDGGRLAATGGQCVRVDAASLCCALRTLDSEGPRVASDLREAPALSPAAPLGWSQDAGSQASRGPLAVIWLLGPALGPGDSWWKLGDGGLRV